MSSWANYNCFDSQLSPDFTDGSVSSGASSCSSPEPSPEQCGMSDSQLPPAVWYQPVKVKHEPMFDICGKKVANTDAQQAHQHQHPKKNSRRRIHIPHSQRPQEFVVKRNARERRRVEAVNDAFRILQATVPTMGTRGSPQRLSKASILRGAIDYIQQLHMALGVSNGTPEHDFYDNNQVFYEKQASQQQEAGKTVYPSCFPNSSSPAPEIPSPVTESLPPLLSCQTTWSQQSEKEQPSVVDLLDSYWSNMSMDELAANISFSDFDIDI